MIESESPMSIDAGPRKFEGEKAAIDEAYADHIKKLFEVYYLGSTTGSGCNDKEALLRFKSNVETLRRAHVHALSVFSEYDI
jgi:hypothetical protein